MPESSHRHEPLDGAHWRCQFSLRTLLVAVTAAAMSVSMCVWQGKDGLFLASLIVPGVTVTLLRLGSLGRRLYLAVVATLMTSGITWSSMFPKTTNVLRLDFIISVAIGVGLIGGGACLIALRRKPLWLGAMTVTLLWSLLLNVVLFACYYRAVKSLVAMNNMSLQQLNATVAQQRAASGLSPAQATRVTPAPLPAADNASELVGRKDTRVDSRNP